MPPPPAAQPVYFGDEALPAFGWWHVAVRERNGESRLPVLICPPFGREDESAHRTLRLMAEQLAAAGHPVLRFDYPGTGDAAGHAHTPDLVLAWTRCVAAALECLKAQAGCGKAAIVGLRLGAVLAAGVAAARDDVAAFVAIAPPVSGRAFVRELKAFQAASAPVGRADASAGLLEAGGHALAAASRDSLSRLDPAALERPPAPRMLVIDRVDMPSATAWASRFTALGAAVDYQCHDGFADMMLDPQSSQAPQSMLDATAAWLGSLPSLERVSPSDFFVRTSALVADGVIEEPVWIPVVQARMFALLSQGSPNVAPSRVVLILNSGAQRRAGPGRLHVMLARRWAAKGMVVLRLDLPGLGDAAARAGERDNLVYPPSVVADLQALMHYVRERWPGVACHVLGVCSGGYHGLQMARERMGIDSVVVLNTLTFDWPGERPLVEPLPAHKVAQEMARYRRNLFALEPWRKLLRGEVDLHLIAGLLVRRVRQRLANSGRDLARLLNLPLRNDLAGELTRATADGGVVHFVFSENEPGEDLLRGLAGRAVGRLVRQRRLHLHRLDDADHTFTGEAARERVAVLMDTLFETTAVPAGRAKLHTSIDGALTIATAADPRQSAGYD
ncbi:MAG: alpha/beta hydrolase [Burkholderiaceae bacterium]